MQDLINKIKRQVAAMGYKPGPGRPRNDQTPAERACRARHKVAQKKKYGRLPTVEPWRCPGCGGLIVLEVCLECEMQAKKHL